MLEIFLFVMTVGATITQPRPVMGNVAILGVYFCMRARAHVCVCISVVVLLFVYVNIVNKSNIHEYKMLMGLAIS